MIHYNTGIPGQEQNRQSFLTVLHYAFVFHDVLTDSPQACSFSSAARTIRSTFPNAEHIENRDLCTHNTTVLYSLDQMPQLLFTSSPNFVRLLFESSYYSRAAFIKLKMEDEEIDCLQQGGVAADAKESI